MAIPQIQRVVSLRNQRVEILRPRRLIVEPGKLLRRVAIVVLCSVVRNLRPLQTQGSAAQFQLRMILVIELRW